MSELRADYLVVGLGAVGSLVAGSLVAGGAGVVAVGRGVHAQAVAEGGLTVRRGAAEVRARLPVRDSIEAAATGAAPSTVILAVKAYDVSTAAEELRAAGWARSESPALVCLANGVGTERLAAAALPGVDVVAASLTSAVTIGEPGVVTVRGRGGLATTRGASHTAGWTFPRSAALGRAVARGGLPSTDVPNGDALKWSKLLLNMIASASCAALDWPPDQVTAHPRLRRLEERAWREALAVMRGLGIPVVALPGYHVDAAARLVEALPEGWAAPLLVAAGRGRGGRVPGPLADLRRGKPRTEVEWLHGAVARHARGAGVQTPACAGLARVVADLAAGRRPWSDVRGRPDALLELVDARGATEHAGHEPDV